MYAVDQLHSLVSREHPARPVIFVRILLGLCHVWKIAVYWPVTAQLLALETFRAEWAPGMSLITDATRPWYFAIWLAGAIGMVFGWLPTVAGTVCGLAVWGLMLMDAQLYSNHLYLLSWMTIFIAITGAKNHSRTVRHWPVFLTCFLISNVYFFTAVSKCNAEFLSGAVLAFHAHIPVLGGPLPFARVLSWLTVAVEFAVAFALWPRKLQPWAFLAGFLMHVGIVLTMEPRKNLVVFSTVMLASYLLFLDARPASRLVIWDDHCGFCGAWVRLFRRLDFLGVLRFEGSSNEALLERHNIPREEADSGLQLIYAGERKSGYDAVVGVLNSTPLTFLWAGLLMIPPVPQIGRRIYARVAERRRCILPAPPVAHG